MPNWRAIARADAKKYGIDPDLFERQIEAESGFRIGATSGAGAQGIAQIMPSTARGWGINANNPRQALDAAASHMASYVKQFGSYENALRAYNAGPGAVQASHGYDETNAYVARIMRGHTGGGGGGQGGGGGGGGGGTGSRTITTTTPGVDNRQARYNLVKSFLFGDKVSPLSFIAKFQSLADVPATTTTRTTGGGGGGTQPAQSDPGGAHPPSVHGSLPFDGHSVAAWIQPVLKYARKHGWQGTVTSGVRPSAEQKQLYDDFVNGRRSGPVAKPGTSNHEMTAFPGGAVDVSDPEALSKILLASKYRNLLVWAGAKDHPHFSHPHNGSY
jgi:hypothetical protein